LQSKQGKQKKIKEKGITKEEQYKKKKKTYGVQEGTFGWKDCQLI
jgi:hypothetical protein